MAAMLGRARKQVNAQGSTPGLSRAEFSARGSSCLPVPAYRRQAQAGGAGGIGSGGCIWCLRRTIVIHCCLGTAATSMAKTLAVNHGAAKVEWALGNLRRRWRDPLLG